MNAALEEIEKSQIDAKARDFLDKVKISRQKYRDARETVINLAMQNKNAEAYALYVTKVDQLAKEYMNQIGGLSDYYTELSKKMNANSQAAFERATQITVSIIVMALLVLGVSGWYITKLMVLY